MGFRHRAYSWGYECDINQSEMMLKVTSTVWVGIQYGVAKFMIDSTAMKHTDNRYQFKNL